MKIFIDTGDIGEIKEAVAMGAIDGVTTNPSLLAKAGKPIKKRSRKSASWSTGRSPRRCSPRRPRKSSRGPRARQDPPERGGQGPADRRRAEGGALLKSEGISTNVTLCFSATQALLAAKAGAGFISPFVGRLDDVSEDGMELIEQIVTIYETTLRDRGAGRERATPDARRAGGVARCARRHAAVQGDHAARQAPAHRHRARRSSSRTQSRSPRS